MSSTEQIATSALAQKLKPLKLGFSPKLAYLVQAVTGFDFGVRDGRGGYAGSLAITSDGFVIANTCSHESGALICTVSDLERNLKLLLAEVNLSDEERAEFFRLYSANVSDWRD